MKVIVYYSYSGNTRMVANKIKDRLGVDVFEITPITPYTNDYDLLVDEARKYVKEGAQPRINKIDLDKYDEIILLTPVWWYTYASPINTFLNTNDFSGKVIYPVATNAGWLGHTFSDIERFGCVKNPLNLVFDGNVLRNEDDLNAWIDRF